MNITSVLDSLLLHLIHATFFATVIVSVLLISTKLTSRMRYLLGWIGLLKFVIPLGMLGISISLFFPGLDMIASLPAMLVSSASGVVGGFTSSSNSLWLIMGGLWFIGLVLVISMTGYRWFTFMRKLREGSVRLMQNK